MLYNKIDDQGKWVPMPLSIGSWVTMKPSTIGSHGIKKGICKTLTSIGKVW